jgi:hypothetical protein
LNELDLRGWGGVMVAEANSREESTAPIDGFTHEIPTTEHRRLHQEASDFVRWGRRMGRSTLALYGRPYFSLLARLGWSRVEVEAPVDYREALR